jgi:hypothetical protein
VMPTISAARAPLYPSVLLGSVIMPALRSQ